MESLSLETFYRSMERKSRDSRRPDTVTFELTYGCNLRCVHCLNPTHKALPKELGFAEISRILEEIAQLGVLDVTFTGGELFTRPDLFPILEKARGLGLLIGIISNATRLTPGIVGRLQGLPLASLFISIYGATARTYEAVTGIPGSYARFRAGLKALLGSKIPVALQMPVMTLNGAELREAQELAKSMGFAFISTTDIYPRQDGDPAPLKYRLGPAEKLSALEEAGGLCRSLAPASGAETPFIGCACGKTQFAITPYGEMNLCTIFPIPKYDLRKGSVAEGWEILKRTVDEARPKTFDPCPPCELRSHCRQGRAAAWLETGDMGACLSHYQELACLEKTSMNPPYPTETFLEAYARISAANQGKLETLKALLARFQEKGVDFLLLKGADLLTRLYSGRGFRFLGDIDLLVREKDLEKIDTLAQGFGLRPATDGNPVYIDSQGAFCLDLATDIWYLPDVREVWDRALRRRSLGLEVRVLEPTDLLIYLSAYACLHRGYFSASWAQDLALLSEKETIDWKRLVQDASRLGLKIALYHAFSNAAARAMIPPEVMASLSPTHLRARAGLWLLKRLVREERILGLSHVLVFLTLPSKRRLSWLGRKFFPKKDFLRYRYGEKSGVGLILLRLWRPIALGIKGVLLLAQAAARLLSK